MTPALVHPAWRRSAPWQQGRSTRRRSAGPVEDVPAVARDQEVIGARIDVEQHVAGRGLRRTSLEGRQTLEILETPNLQSRLAPPERNLPAVDFVLEALSGRLIDNDWRPRQVGGHPDVRLDDEVEIALGPRFERMPSMQPSGWR